MKYGRKERMKMSKEYLEQLKGINPLYTLPKIKCGACGKKQLSQICKDCRAKNQAVIDGKQEVLG